MKPPEENSLSSISLIRNPVKRRIIIKAEVAGVDDVIRACLFGKLIERFQVPYKITEK